MNEWFLIPANTKKSMLIFGLFNKYDFVIAGIGILITLIMSVVFPIEQFTFALIALIPAGISILLVSPIPNYHNVLTAIISMYSYFTNRRTFIWKGWCIRDEEE